MSSRGEQIPMSKYQPDPVIRGLLGNPVRSGEIRTSMLNGAQVVSPPYGVKSNPWNVSIGHDPQDISGALDTNAKDEVEEGIHQSFIARIWPDGRHYYIITSDLVFALNSSSQSTGSTTVLNLGSLNTALREGFLENERQYLSFLEEDQWKTVIPLSESELFGTREYHRWVESDPSKRLIKSDESETTMDDSSELRLHRIKADNSSEITDDLSAVSKIVANRASKRTTNGNGNGNGNDKFALFLLSAIKENVKKELETEKKESAIISTSRTFWKEKMNLTSQGLRYLYVGSVSDHWTMLGVVRSSINDTGYDQHLVNNARGSGVDIAVTMAKKTHELYNYWHNDLKEGDLLYLILKRIKRSDNSWGEIQFVPFSSGKNYPKEADRMYVDFSGEWQRGRVIYVGMLAGDLRDGKRPPLSRAMASGLVPGQTCKDAFEASVLLDKLVCFIGIGTEKYGMM